MKTFLTLLIYSLFIPFIFAQNHSFTIRINDLTTQNRDTDEVFDTILRSQQYNQQFNGFDIDLAYKNFIEKDWGVVARFGLDRANIKLEQEVVDPVSGVSFTSEQTRIYNRFQLNLGAFYQPWKSKKLSTGVGAEFVSSFQPAYSIERYQEEKDAAGNLYNYTISKAETPSVIGLGLQFNSNIYYYIVERLGIGMEFNLQFLYNHQKGEGIESRITRNRNDEILNKVERTYDVVEKNFGKRFFLSFGIQYQF